MKQRDLAKALQLTPQRVSQLVNEGMPMTSVEAAREWRRRNLEQRRTQEGKQASREYYLRTSKDHPLPKA